MMIKKNIICIIIVCIVVSLCSCNSDKTVSYKNPESLIRDFLNEYLYVSLEQATDRMKRLDEDSSIHIVMEDAFTNEGIEQVTANGYLLMMDKLAIELNSDIVIDDLEVKQESDSKTEQRYIFHVALDYPMADNDTVPREIEGYFDVQLLDNEWKINTFKVQSYAGVYPS
ncbi:MAG: hypothetical protein SOW34_16890 [Oliverpabstia sp.]|nr:hypothetical protein [Oliverpabstia sp.]